MTIRPAEVDAVLLDLGNVLVFHDDRFQLERFAALGGRTPEAIRVALQEVWLPSHRGELAGDDLRRAVCAAIGAELDEPAFLAAWSCHFQVHHDVLPLVASLVGRVKLVLLSNTNAAHYAAVSPLLPILDRFDSLVLSHQVGLAKPEPAIYAEALRRAGSTPERTAYFDDVEAYVHAARALGIRGHVFTDAPSFARQIAALGL